MPQEETLQSEKSHAINSSRESVLQFDHIAQQVPDITEAVAWYLKLLPGAKVLFQDTSWAFMEANGTRLAFVKKDQHPSHLAWRVSNAHLEMLAAQYQQPITTHRDKTRSFYLEGPGSQWIEIICMEEAKWAQKSDERTSGE